MVTQVRTKGKIMKRTGTHTAIFLFFALLITAPPPIVEAAQKGKGKAVAAFKKGKRALKAKRYKEATRSFRRANKIAPAATYQLFLGRSLAGQGHSLEAIKLLNQFLDQADDETPPRQVTRARKTLEVELSKVGLLEITGPPGATGYINGTAIGTLPFPSAIPVVPGERHSVWVVYNDHQLPVNVVSVDPGQSTELVFREPVAEDPYEASQEVELDPEELPITPRPLRTWGWVGTGVGAAIVIGGVITGAIALSKDKELVDACGTDPCPEKKAEVKSRDDLATTTTVLLVGGGAVAATSIVILIIDAVQNKKEKDVAVYPSLSPTNVGASLVWRF
jgi:hypothetical protein